MNNNILCTCTDKIPAHRFKQFNEILIACGGRYLHKPQHIGQRVFVEYKFVEDVGLGYVEFCERWNRVRLRIVEKRSVFIVRIWLWLKGRLKA
jgi:hypothetical protein